MGGEEVSGGRPTVRLSGRAIQIELIVAISSSAREREEVRERQEERGEERRGERHVASQPHYRPVPNRSTPYHGFSLSPQVSPERLAASERML